MDPLYDDEPYMSRVIPGLNGAQTDYEECMTLPRYNISRKTTHGIPFTDMANMFPDEPWLEFCEFPQWFYPQFGYFDNMILSLFLLVGIFAAESWPCCRSSLSSQRLACQCMLACICRRWPRFWQACLRFGHCSGSSRRVR